jgi:hypothetical protein
MRWPILRTPKFKRVKKAILGEIEVAKRPFSDQKIYSLVVAEFEGDTSLADTWMLSHFGGYTQGNLNAIKSKIDYQRNVADVRAKAY